MALKEFKRIDYGNRELKEIQESVREFTNQLNKIVLDGNYLKTIPDSNGKLVPIVIGIATTAIPHGLGREFQGFQVLDIQGDARVWRDAASTVDKTKFLPLKASAAVTVNLWVF